MEPLETVVGFWGSLFLVFPFDSTGGFGSTMSALLRTAIFLDVWGGSLLYMGLAVFMGLWALYKDGMALVCFGPGLFVCWLRLMLGSWRNGGIIGSQRVFFCGIILYIESLF